MNHPMPPSAVGSTMAQWREYLRSAPPTAVFDEAELAGLDEPVRRYLRAAIAPGTPLHSGVEIKMRGALKLGRWLPFRARQVLEPTRGFRWQARVAGVISGHDQYSDHVGEMSWKLGGLLTVAEGSGPDVSRSAAGRGAAESVWAPTTLLPRFGVHWSAVDDATIVARRTLGPAQIALRISVDHQGLATALVFDRWGDPEESGTWGTHSFGGVISAHRTFHGMTIPSAGCLGWHVGADGRAANEFFRFRILELDGV